MSGTLTLRVVEAEYESAYSSYCRYRAPHTHPLTALSPPPALASWLHLRSFAVAPIPLSSRRDGDARRWRILESHRGWRLRTVHPTSSAATSRPHWDGQARTVDSVSLDAKLILNVFSKGGVEGGVESEGGEEDLFLGMIGPLRLSDLLSRPEAEWQELIGGRIRIQVGAHSFPFFPPFVTSRMFPY